MPITVTPAGLMAIERLILDAGGHVNGFDCETPDGCWFYANDLNRLLGYENAWAKRIVSVRFTALFDDDTSSVMVRLGRGRGCLTEVDGYALTTPEAERLVHQLRQAILEMKADQAWLRRGLWVADRESAFISVPWMAFGLLVSLTFTCRGVTGLLWGLTHNPSSDDVRYQALATGLECVALPILIASTWSLRPCLALMTSFLPPVAFKTGTNIAGLELRERAVASVVALGMSGVSVAAGLLVLDGIRGIWGNWLYDTFVK